MAVKVPEGASLSPIRSNISPTPVDQIIKVRGRNLIGEGAQQTGQVLAEAIQRRYEIQRQAQMTAAVGEQFGLPPEQIQQLAASGINADQLAKIAEYQYTKAADLNAKRNATLLEINKQRGSQTYTDPATLKSVTVPGSPDLGYTEDNGMTKVVLPADSGNKGVKFGTGGEGQEGYRATNAGLRAENYKNQILDKFNGDPEVKKAEETASLVGTVKTMIDVPEGHANPIADKAVTTVLTRVFEKGALTEEDKKPYGGSQALEARAEQALQEWGTGTLSPANRVFLLSLTETLGNRSVLNKLRIARKRADQYGKNSVLFKGGPPELYGLMIGEADVDSMKALNPTADYGFIPKPVPGVPTGGDYITIRGSDGSVHKLPKANLIKARQRDSGLVVLP